MSDGGRERASFGVNVWKSSQKWSAQRSAVRSIAWLDARVQSSHAFEIGIRVGTERRSCLKLRDSLILAFSAEG